MHRASLPLLILKMETTLSALFHKNPGEVAYQHIEVVDARLVICCSLTTLSFRK
jgi:hypothetical protein